MKKLFFFTVLCLTLIACRLSTDDLAKEVQASIEETLKTDSSGIKITSFVLTQKGGNEYAGVLDTDESGNKFTYNVEVIYDGKNMKWEIIK